MNKSKFLKKSLAALLAVMLVVAMVPLSAAADEMPEFPLPNMTRLYINGSDVALEDGVFAADIAEDADDVELRADSGSLGTAGFNQATLAVLKSDSVTSKQVTTTAADFDFADYATEENGVVTLKLRLTSVGNKESFKDFEVKLTRTTQGTTAELESATPIQSTGLYTAEIGDNVINVTVAREAGSTAGSTNPSITLKAKDNATIAGTVSGRPLTAGNTVRVDKVADGETITITSESGNNTAEWTFKVTYVDALDTISVNGVTGVISDKLDNSNFTTTTPDGIPDTVTVSLEASAFEDTLGNIQLTKKLPVSFSVKGNITTVNINAATDINAATNATEVKAGGTFTFDSVNSTNPSRTYNLWVPSGNDGTNKDWQQYKLVIELKRDNSTAIESAVIMDEIATIDGAKIHAVLPEQTATGATINLGAINDIKLVTDSSVTSVYMDDTTTPPVNFFKKTANTPVAGKTTWSADTSKTADLSTPKIITVTAQNGEIQQYTISAEKDTNRTLAELNSITLQDPAGNRYNGVISGHKVTFNNIPYMTTSLLDWKVFAEPNASATALISNGTPAQNVTIVNGTTTGEKLFADATMAVAPNKTRTYTGVNVKVVNKNDQSVFTEYTTELVLVAPKTGNTLSSLKVSAQTTTPVGAINNVVNDRITDANTITGEIKKKYTDNTGTITFKQPFSLSRNNSQSSGVYDVITELTTDNGGVAYIGEVNNGVLSFNTSSTSSVGKMSALSSDKKTFGSSYMIVRKSGGFWGKLAIVVLPEEIARTVASNATSIVKVDTDLGTVYSVKDEALDAEHNPNLKSIAIGDTTLTISGDKITGTLPYSLTTDKTDGTNAKFVTFETQSNFAYWPNYNSDGKVNGVEAGVSNTNRKLSFKRNADHTVDVYELSASASQMTNNEFTVNAEDCLVGGVGATHSTHKYTFDLKWADPNTEAKITSFSVTGRTGAISGQNVTVAVPYLTDVKGLIPTFTLSSGATMMLDDASKGVIESGKTTLDFSNPVKVIVKSEDGKRTEHYTITVNEGEMFTDVNTNDWFYDVVLKAATEGWINGRGDGIFDPYSTMTRADFANIIAKMQGFNPDDYTDSRFADVPSSHYASAAIAFCADKEYINGVGDNNFDPGANITREQAAAIVCRVNGIKEEAGNTTYADDANISTWAKGYVKAATTSGIFEGEGEGFNPQRPLRRCEGAAILVRSTSK